MTEEKPLKKILKKRKLTLGDLYLKMNEEIRLTRLSDIRVARVVPTKNEIEILSKYLDLTDKEIEDLEDMEIDKILIENSNNINNVLKLVPKMERKE